MLQVVRTDSLVVDSTPSTSFSAHAAPCPCPHRYGTSRYARKGATTTPLQPGEQGDARHTHVSTCPWLEAEGPLHFGLKDCHQTIDMARTTLLPWWQWTAVRPSRPPAVLGTSSTATRRGGHVSAGEARDGGVIRACCETGTARVLRLKQELNSVCLNSSLARLPTISR
jgi:hypothetical protein